MTGGSPWSRRALAAVGIFGLVFLTVPLLIVVPMSFSSARALTFPPPGFSLRWYEAFFGDPRWMDAMWTSAALAALSSVAALVLGSLAAYGLRRGPLRRPRLGGGQLHGAADRAHHHRRDRALSRAGQGRLAGLASSAWSSAHTVLNVPLVMMVMGVAIREFDLRIEQVAWSLGASWRYTVRQGRAAQPGAQRLRRLDLRLHRQLRRGDRDLVHRRHATRPCRRRCSTS